MKERSGMPYDVVAYESDDLAMQLNECEEGLFHRMLRRSWMNGSIPADLVQLARIIRTPYLRLKRAWVRISPLWIAHDSLPGRLINLKQEAERAWVVAKSGRNSQAANERWKAHKTKETADANALPSQSERNASPSPPLPNKNIEGSILPNGSLSEYKSTIQVLPAPQNVPGDDARMTFTETRSRLADLHESVAIEVEQVEQAKKNAEALKAKLPREPDRMYELWAEAYRLRFDVVYVPTDADWVGMARRRKAEHLGPRDSPPHWETVVDNAMHSNLPEFTIKFVMTKFANLTQGPINQYGRLDNSNGRQGYLTKDDITRHELDKLRTRLHAEAERRGERPHERGHGRRLP